jgi:serine/threonine protein kinase/Tfp pilus assembly protein PilF
VKKVIGKTISHYKVLEKIGEGGMGVVYKAEDTKLKRTIALKFLPPELTRDQEARGRFMKEAQAAAALDHPHICTVHEIDETDGKTFIAMAYIEGQSIKEKIEAGPLEIDEAVDIALQIAEGLKEAHDKGITHRDIKPANIMLTAKGQAKIMDFGLAKLEWGPDLTKTATILGTVAYMSPEQARGEKVDLRTDIWSLGCVLYEMLSGQKPFKSAPDQAAIYAIMNESPQPLNSLRKELPQELVGTVNKCLEKNPDKRYQKAGEIAADLSSLRKKLKSEVTEKQPAEKKPSIAVLPFVDMSPQRDQEYFCDGIAEELINALTHIKDLRVVARTSAFAFRGEKVDVREIGKKLNVSAVLEGSIRKAGNRIRVTTQLINVEDGYHLWSEKFDREMEDIFAIQDEISLAIVDHLKVKLLAREKDAIEKRPTDDPEAYNLYIKGLYFNWQTYEDAFDRSLDYYNKAIDKNPTFALPYVGIGMAYVGLSALSLRPPANVLPKAKAALKKAQELDDSLAEVHFLAAALAYWFDFDWEEAEKRFQKTFELNPGFALAHSQYPWFLLAMNRFDEVIREIKLAQELDPLKPLFYAMSVGLHRMIGKHDEAIREFHRAIELDPDIGLAYFHLGCVYLDKGMMEEAASTFKKSIELVTGAGWAEAKLGIIHVLQGEKEKAQQILDELVERKKKNYVESFSIASLYSHLGHTDKAFEYLDLAYEERDTLMPYLNVISVFELSKEVYADPRYKKLLKKMKLEK